MPSLLSRCGGGGSLASQQGLYTADGGSIASGGNGDGSWALSLGDALLDLTTPTLPTVLADGLYIVSADFQTNGGGTAGRPMRGSLVFNTTTPLSISMDIINPSGGFGAFGAVSGAARMPAGTFMRFAFFNQDTAAHTMVAQAIYVVFLSPVT